MDQVQWIIGDFLYLSRERRVQGPDGRQVRLNPKSARVLELFLARPKQPLSYHCLLELAWDGRIVSDCAIRRVMADIRKAFRDDHRAPLYLQTLQNQGYCWLVPPKRIRLEPSPPSHDRWWLPGLTVALISALLVWEWRGQPPTEASTSSSVNPGSWPRFSAGTSPNLVSAQPLCQPMAKTAHPPLRY